MNDPLAPLAPQRVGYMLLHGALTEIRGAMPARSRGRVYEVLRVHAGRPIFFKEHMARMERSAALSGLAFPAAELWSEPLLRLCNLQQGTQNLQLMLLEDGSLEAHFIESHYPTPRQREEGVALGIIDGERPCPHAKLAGHAVRAAAEKAIKESAFFEVLLRNRAGEITEGSRSNVLFVAGDTLVTPPLAAVLPGITLAKVKQAAALLSFSLKERPIPCGELGSFTAAAVLGTSPGVLPIKSIAADGATVLFDVKNDILRQLQKVYTQLMLQED